jgi:lysophospholipase L1-like esterase
MRICFTFFFLFLRGYISAFGQFIDMPALMKELNIDQIRSITTGAYSIKQHGEYICFSRFPDSVKEALKLKDTWAIRSESTSGVKITFFTNSEKLFLTGTSLPESPQFESFVLLCNDALLLELPGNKEMGDFSQVIRLPGKGMKLIEIYFPAYAKGMLGKIAVDKHASIMEYDYSGKVLSFGNSITQQGGKYQGYLDIFAGSLNYALHNAGVGGHVFHAESIPFRYVSDPNFIIVAYGTNDWSSARPFTQIELFFEQLVSLYPDIQIVVLEPLHRFEPYDPYKNELKMNIEGKSLMQYRNEIRQIAGRYSNTMVISYNMLLEDDPELFSDGVHPNPVGHILLGENLSRILKDEIIIVF